MELLLFEGQQDFNSRTSHLLQHVSVFFALAVKRIALA
jgi:hypothetical protein